MSPEKCGAVVTAENHNRIGGLTSAVSDLLSRRRPTRVEHVAVEDSFGEVGPQNYLEERFGLTAQHIAAAAEQVSIDGRVLQVSASLGVTFFPQTDEVDADPRGHDGTADDGCSEHATEAAPNGGGGGLHGWLLIRVHANYPYAHEWQAIGSPTQTRSSAMMPSARLSYQSAQLIPRSVRWGPGNARRRRAGRLPYLVLRYAHGTKHTE